MLEIKVTLHADETCTAIAQVIAGMLANHDSKNEGKPVSTVACDPAPIPLPNAVPPKMRDVKTPDPAETAAPTTARKYTFQEIGRAAATFADTSAEARANVVHLMTGTFGVKKFSDLPEYKFGQFATELRKLGAKI